MNTEILQYRTAITNLVDAFVDVAAHVSEQSDDFEVEGYRFIRMNCIDDIQLDELSNDEYVLGSFRDYFIAENCEIDLEVVQALQETEKYEVLGRLMVKSGIEDLQAEYARLDGYGHHFAHYDHETHEIGEYYAFRVD